jgi:PAS domain S-box-containing protein
VPPMRSPLRLHGRWASPAVPFETLVENSPAVAFLKDAAGRHLYVNPAFERVFARPRASALGLTNAQLFPPEAARELVEHDARVLAGDETVELDEVVPAADGTLRHWRVFKFPVAGPGGERLLGGMAVDVTAERQAAEALRHASRAAADVARVRSEFVVNVSHELRTPLNVILGFTDLVLESALTDEQRRHLETVRLASVDLLRLIGDILDLSSIDAGRLGIAPVPTALGTLLPAALEPMATIARQKGLALTWAVDPTLGDPVLVDPLRLRQVLANLVGNALKFTEHGAVTVAVVRDASAGAPTLHFTVADTGIGIPPERQRAIFEPFVQGDGSTTRRHGGTGLGLTIAARLVELMGGEIWVESTPGRGSTFHFTVRPAPDDSC